MLAGLRRSLASVERVATTAIVLVICFATPDLSMAQTMPPTERDALVQLRVNRGGRADEVDALLRVAGDAGAKGLPVAPLTSKIREGLSKGADPARIDAVIRQMVQHLESSDRVLRELHPSGVPVAQVTLLAEALGGGVTVEEVGALRAAAQGTDRPPIAGDLLAGAAKGLSFIKEAKLPVSDGTAVVAEAVRQGFRQHDLLDLGREVKRRERDYREGRASLVALREAIARGSRPDQLFRDSRAAMERPAAARPEPATRPEPVTRPERPQPTERPTRPERPAGTTR